MVVALGGSSTVEVRSSAAAALMVERVAVVEAGRSAAHVVEGVVPTVLVVVDRDVGSMVEHVTWSA